MPTQPASAVFTNREHRPVAAVQISNGASRMPSLLQQFFLHELEVQRARVADGMTATYTRWDDPGVLAARFVAWLHAPARVVGTIELVDPGDAENPTEVHQPAGHSLAHLFPTLHDGRVPV